MITTTLNRIRANHPCKDVWEKLLTGLGKTAGDDEPLPFSRIVEISGMEDALWCCRAEPQYGREWRSFAVWCAQRIQHLMPDDRSIGALRVAERHANGLASDEELGAARAAVMDGPRSAAWHAARDAAWDAAMGAAMAAPRAAAMAAAMDAARDGGAWAIERDAAWDAQQEEFLRIVGGQ